LCGNTADYAENCQIFFLVRVAAAIDIVSQIPPVKPAACFCEPLKAVDFGAA
jgi:hypothetical protein